jgi:hypothetical protein
MNKLSGFRARRPFSAQAVTRVAALAAVALSVTTLAGCTTVSEATKQRVASSGITLQQAQETIGRSEDGMMELQHAKESLDAAQKAVAEPDDKEAQRMAARAELQAQLAVAQSQSAAARRAAAEVAASTDSLRSESDRASAPATPSTRTP